MITGAETAHLTPKTPTIYLEGKLPLVEAATAAELGLKDSQVVQATVENRPEGMRLWLQGAQQGQHIDLPKDLPAAWRLASGDTALFKVQVLANGAVMLRPLQAAPLPAAATAPPPESPLPGRLAQLSFRPPDMSALTQFLRPDMLARLMQGLNPASPEMAAMQQWLRQRPSMAQLSSEKLQQLIKGSGWMTENLLTQGQGAGLVDLKSLLRQLLKSDQASDADAADLIQESLDDIESRQLMSADTLGSKEWVFSMMLPFSDAEPVALRFVKSRRQPGQDKPPLVIHLHTRNRDLGEIWLQTKISHETEVEMVMWALREDVVAKAKSQAGNLADELDSAGLRMMRLQVVHGPGPQEPMHWAPPEMGSMVDVQT
jgi:hypothetical protein